MSDGEDFKSPSVLLAEDLRNSGIQTYAVGLEAKNLGRALPEAIARSPGRYFDTPSPERLGLAYVRILEDVVSSLAGNVVLDPQSAAAALLLTDGSQEGDTARLVQVATTLKSGGYPFT